MIDGNLLADLLAVATVAAMLSVTVFVVIYALSAPWHRSPLGRVLMGSGLALLVLTGVGTLRRIDNRATGGDYADALAIGSIVGYTVVALAWAYKTRVIVRENRRHPESPPTEEKET